MTVVVGFSYFSRSEGKTRHTATQYHTAGTRLIKVIEVDPALVDIRVALAKKDGVYGESFSDMMARLHPTAAINGTLYGKDMQPLGDVLVDGKIEVRGGYKNALAIGRDGKPTILRRTRRTRFPWSNYKYGVASGPRLVHGGKIMLDPVGEGFSKRSLSIEAWRCGVGLTKSGHVVLVTATRSLTLDQFAHVMKDLGSVEAMNLDGGGACALYHRGTTLVSPNLPMTNVITVFEKRSK